MAYTTVSGLQVSTNVHDLINEEILPGTQVSAGEFWPALAHIIDKFSPNNRKLLEERDRIQNEIDGWLRKTNAVPDSRAQRDFLKSIGYLVDEGDPFQVNVENVDEEIARIAGPQLVVPVQNSRYALNAANARWGSLYDAVYGTDVIGPPEPAKHGYDPVRGRKVVEYVKQFLDRVTPLQTGTFSNVKQFELEDQDGIHNLKAIMKDESATRLADEAQFSGYNAVGGELSEVIFKNNGLHVRLLIDKEDRIGRSDPAGIKDVILESAVTTIQDFEDSVAVVDAQDKALIYRNWLGLMKGDLEAAFKKDGKDFVRHLNQDVDYRTPDGSAAKLHGRSVMFARNVGLHMYTDCILDAEGSEIPEGILDAMVSCLAAKHDLLDNGRLKNSRKGSIYIVKPKLHGPDEVKFTIGLFEAVEEVLNLNSGTVKIGIMDEERRTTVNLKECIRAARNRVVFINTGFLDRTGDEIHTFMQADAVIPKSEIKNAVWLSAYENWNVDIGIESGLPGHGQIGKGMWPMPDSMKAMVATKIAHPQAGASTAWVPSPTAATLHAMHYHEVDVAERQRDLVSRTRASIHELLTPSLLGDRQLTDSEIEKELENNAQGILGYVARWVGQGIGCSKVPDIDDVALMEDRATLRISSQHIANWLEHGIVTRDRVVSAMKRMAQIVDTQNAGDPAYQPMASNFDKSIEVSAALDLVFLGAIEPNGYTEKVLHTHRREKKKGLISDAMR